MDKQRSLAKYPLHKTALLGSLEDINETKFWSTGGTSWWVINHRWWSLGVPPKSRRFLFLTPKLRWSLWQHNMWNFTCKNFVDESSYWPHGTFPWFNFFSGGPPKKYNKKSLENPVLYLCNESMGRVDGWQFPEYSRHVFLLKKEGWLLKGTAWSSLTILFFRCELLLSFWEFAFFCLTLKDTWPKDLLACWLPSSRYQCQVSRFCWHCTSEDKQLEPGWGSVNVKQGWITVFVSWE